MAKDGQNLPNSAAEDIIFSNLGLTREDLGVEDTGSGNEPDLGSGNEPDLGSGNEPDESRVTHTREQEPPEVQTRLPSGAEVKPDKAGNLVGADGRIVARAGKEARLYQDLHKTRGQAQTLQGQINDVTGRLRKAVEIGQGLHRELVETRAQVAAVKQFGLSQDEHLTALRLFKELRDNPGPALKNILTRAATNGINVAELGLPAGGVDPKTLVDIIRQEIGTVVAPLKERTAEENRQRQQNAEIERRKTEINQEVATFFDSNPEAKEYLPVFTKTVQQFPGMTLGEIWARIQLHFALNPQARRPQNSRQRSVPSGRSAPPNGGGENDMAPVTDSYEAIIRHAMDQAGIPR